jgi:hypothetical protein
MTVAMGARVSPWMDAQQAAEYTALPVAEIARAIARRDLPATSTHPERPRVWMMRARDVEVWAEGRNSGELEHP